MKRTSFALSCMAAIAATSMLLASVQTSRSAVAAAPGAGGGRGGAGGAGGLGGRAGGGAGGGGARGPGRGPAAPLGPPAPVPPEVAIPRPTAAEVTQLNDILGKALDGDTADKETIDKWRSLFTVQVPRPNTASVPTQTQQRTGQRHTGFVTQAKAGDIDLLFEGDSITDWWTRNGPNAYKKYFDGIKVANFAIAGDTTQGVLWGLQNGEGQGFKPKAIMLMIGTNNDTTNTAPEIAEGVGAIIFENRKDFPDAKILLLGIFPRGPGPTDANRLKNEEVNKIIPKLADNQHVYYMDIGPKFIDDKGVLLGGTFMNDNLHPTESGYEIWGAAVTDTLKGWLK